jgi:alkylated DNA repair protein alkB family protein 6
VLDKANHILINKYEVGVGIMPHKDGPLYNPYVVILSIGSDSFFNFY